MCRLLQRVVVSTSGANVSQPAARCCQLIFGSPHERTASLAGCNSASAEAIALSPSRAGRDTGSG
eukprot:m.10756 g.10756  ORF g.10756 m.10756 type:complete len:65 (+) comp2775_c0_seq1:227-421(+)